MNAVSIRGALIGGTIDMTPVLTYQNTTLTGQAFTIPLDLSNVDLVYIHFDVYTGEDINRDSWGYCPVTDDGVEIRLGGRASGTSYAIRSFTVYRDRIEVGALSTSISGGKSSPDIIKGYKIR